MARGPCPLTQTHLRTELVRQQPQWPSTRSLLPGPPAHAHWPQDVAHCSTQVARGWAWQPLRRPLSICLFPPSSSAPPLPVGGCSLSSSLLGNVWARALPPQGTVLRASARPVRTEGGSLVPGPSRSAASPPALALPCTGFGMRSLGSRGTLERKWKNPSNHF